MEIKIKKKILKCEKTGQRIKFSFKNDDNEKVYDEIICPDIDDFLKKLKNTSCPNQYNFNGVCINGVCDCYAGYNSDDNCETKLDNSRNTFTTYFSEF